ncbi:hypothetical protein chiPu_0032697, partial [Chiloscyllium punctatum]|nr:hypothetical protein [Chiloscyllium punctatum]
RGGFRCGELRADRTGEIAVGGVPRAGRGIAEDGVAEFTDHVVDAAVQKLRDVIGIDRAPLVQHDGERVGGRGDDRRRWRRNHALSEDRPGSRRVRLEVIVFDRSDEPAIRVIRERSQIGPAVRLAHFTGLLVFQGRYDRGVDRPEVADERAPGDAQPDLRLLPRMVGLLALQDLAHGVADRDQLANDPR